MDHGTDRGHRRGCRPDVSTALVTGATAGIGAEFARQLAAAGHDLVLVARNAERLSSIARELGSAHDIDCDVIVADLVTDEGMAAVEHRLRAESQPVDLLVNSAGFGLPTSFLKSAVDDEEAMLRVFVLAVLRLSHAALPGMVARGRGAVVNVSSVAGSYLRDVLSGEGVGHRVQRGTTHSTCGHRRPGHGPVLRLRPHRNARADGRPKPGPSWVWLDAQDVVAVALRDLRRGKAVSVPGTQEGAGDTGRPAASCRATPTRISQTKVTVWNSPWIRNPHRRRRSHRAPHGSHSRDHSNPDHQHRRCGGPQLAIHRRLFRR